MSTQIWSDVDVAVQTLLGAAKVITAITKANPAVATCNAHGLAEDQVVLLRMKGFGELDYAVVRVGDVDANTFELAGVDTSDFTDAFVSGTAELVTFGVNAQTFTDVTPSGGEAAKTLISTIHKKRDYNVSGKESPVAYAFGSLWDVSDPALLALRAASRAKRILAVRFAWPDGTELLFAGQPSVSFAPAGSAGAAVTTPVSIDVRGWLQAYEGA